MIISIDAEKLFDTYSTSSLTIKTFNKLYTEKHLNIIKAMCSDKPKANIILHGERLKNFLRLRTRKGCPLSLLLFNKVPYIRARETKQEKQMRYNYTLVRSKKLLSKDKVKSWQEYGKKESTSTVCDDANWCCTMENMYEGSSKKLKLELPLGDFPDGTVAVKNLPVLT